MMHPDIMTDMDKLKKVWKEISRLSDLKTLAIEYIGAYDAVQEWKEIYAESDDQEMKDLADMQIQEWRETLKALEEKVKIALLPKDEDDDKNIYLEIRPAAWGDEAWLFASELLRAYLMYAQKQSWKTDVVEEQLSDIGWLKFAMIKISWENVYEKLKRESGVHRVQRIPQTESQWRVHTSTITVAIMPEIDDVHVDIDPKDVEMDTFAASSAWWQNANKNQTWVRLRHQPTGIIVTIADSKSQMHNKEKARNILKAKLYQLEQEKKTAESREIRWDQIGTWDRSEKIRTYNFPQDRVTDHRIKQSRSNLPWILSGDIDDIIQTMTIENQAKLMASLWK